MLAAQHEQRPGAASDVAALFEVGWPGESAPPEAAAQRVYTTVWRLRRSGLREVLARRGDGYSIEASLRLKREPG